MEFDQAVIIPIISEIENPAIVGPSKNDGMLGLRTDGWWPDLLRTFGRTDLLLNRRAGRWQWQLVRLVNLIRPSPVSHRDRKYLLIQPQEKVLFFRMKSAKIFLF